jgi:hypothetical protein
VLVPLILGLFAAATFFFLSKDEADANVVTVKYTSSDGGSVIVSSSKGEQKKSVLSPELSLGLRLQSLSPVHLIEYIIRLKEGVCCVSYGVFTGLSGLA